MSGFFKKYFAIIILLLLNHCLLSQDKLALLVGIGDYSTDTGWGKLSAVNDLRIIKDALIKQGFYEKDILVLNEQLSKTDILNAIQNQLIDKAQPGTVAVFHYSGHGQQVTDDNNDELDGLDEALVPFDSPQHFSKGIYEGEKLIRDDELGALFYKVRKKIGANGQLLVIMDACHSGTGTRGFLTARGTDVVMADPQKNKLIKTKDRSKVEKINAADNGNIAPMISFFSSEAQQYSYEKREADGKEYGMFSYAFSKYFAEANKATSYQTLLDQIKYDIRSSSNNIQTPHAEGNLDLPLLSNKLLGESNYFKVTQIIDKQMLQINAGSLHGVHEGATIGFYPVDTRDRRNSKPIVTGKVVYADIIKADVEFEVPQDLTQLKGTWAYLLEKNYGNLKVQVQLDINDIKLKNDLASTLSNAPIIQIVNKLPDVLIKQTKTGSLQLISKEGNGNLTFGVDELDEIRKQLMGYAQADYLRQLQINNPLFQAKIEIVQNNKTNSSKMTYRLGEEIQVKITNIGKEPFYFNLLDIMPDNAISPIDLSGGKHTIEEMYLKAGASFTSVLMVVGEPVGVDVFKLIASSEPMDLSVIKGTSNRNYNDLNPLEILLNSTNINTNKRGTTSNLSTSFEVNVESIIFEIIK